MSHPRSLDALDPPPWPPAPPKTSYLIETTHALRQKPIDDFTDEDLRIMIGQRIGLRHLVPIALARLKNDPFAGGDYFAGDLLLAVLRLDQTFWQMYPALVSLLRETVARATAELGSDQRLDEQTRREIEQLVAALPRT